MYACLAVTCHLHFWQNDWDLLRATVVTRGWNVYWNKSQHRKSTLEKKILPPFQQGFEPATFQSRARRSNHWAIPAPPINSVFKKTFYVFGSCFRMLAVIPISDIFLFSTLKQNLTFYHIYCVQEIPPPPPPPKKYIKNPKVFKASETQLAGRSNTDHYIISLFFSCTWITSRWSHLWSLFFKTYLMLAEFKLNFFCATLGQICLHLCWLQHWRGSYSDKCWQHCYNTHEEISGIPDKHRHESNTSFCYDSVSVTQTEQLH